MALKEKLAPYRTAILIISGVIFGSIAGLIAGDSAVVVKPFGDIFLFILFTLVTPLVLVLITGATAKFADLRKLGKSLGVMMAIFVAFGVVAAFVMIVCVRVYAPATGFTAALPALEGVRQFSPDMLVGIFFVPDFVDILSRGHILPAIVFALMLGVSLSMVGEKAKPVVDFLSGLSDALVKFIGLVMWYAPIGIGCYFAYLVGTLGPQLLGDFARAMVLCWTVMPVWWVVAYSVAALLSGGWLIFRRWWRYIPPAAATAFGTCSSCASIPVNLEAAKNMGVPEYIRDLYIPIGATVHMDGACLSTILKIAFLCQLCAVPFFTPGMLAMSVFVAVVSAIAFTGVPGGGFIGEMMIVTLFGFPAEGLPLIVAIGTLNDPVSTLCCSTGDTGTALLGARVMEGKNWWLKGLE